MRLSDRSRSASTIPLPPRRLRGSVGVGDFRTVGEDFLGYFTELSGLEPHEHVLDVGCGCGRMAAPLTSYLSPEACYEGFDIQPAAIKWCRKNIARRFPGFSFTLADVFNTTYNRKGNVAPNEYRFPYEDDRFDFVVLASVFTHMLRFEVEHYLDEIARVMKPRARCLITFFLLDEYSRAAMQAGTTAIRFPHRVRETSVQVEENPEAAVAFPEDYVRSIFGDRGLSIDEIRFGAWSGRQEYLSFQDVVLAHS